MTDKERIRAIIKQYADKGKTQYRECCDDNESASLINYWDGYKDCADGLLRELENIQEVQEPRYPSFEESQGECHPFQDIALTDKDMKKELIKNMVSLIVGEALLEFIEKPTSPKIVNDMREKYSEKILSAIDSMQEEPKKCVYSKDNYTDEDRKVLCDGCEKECIDKINDERKRDLSLWSLGDFENNFLEIIKPYKDSHNYKNLCIRLVVWRSELWRWIHWKKRKEEPVSSIWHNIEELSTARECEYILVIYKDTTAPRVAGNKTQVSFWERVDKWAYLEDILNLSNVKSIVKDCEEPVSEDLEEAYEQLAEKARIHKAKTISPFFSQTDYIQGVKDGANWQKEKDDEEKVLIYKRGFEDCKEQIMAKAVDAVVKIDAGGYPYVDRTIELYDYDKDIPLAKRGDKVKILVIKES